MPLQSLLSNEAVLPALKVSGKKQLFQELASSAEKLWDLDERAVFDALLEREALGATSVGDGVAIPHARLGGIETIYGVFARLSQPIDFDAVDERPVDLVFLLLAPEAANAEHLKALAKISRTFKEETLRKNLRGADGREAIFSMLTENRSRAA